MPKVEQLNELLHRELAAAINRELELPEVFVTVSYVSCTPDLQHAKVAVSVLPDKMAGTALKKLKASSGKIASGIIKKTRLRKIPRLLWEFDPTEKKAADLEEVFLKIDQDEDDNISAF
ncbi:MAG: 30S ribosome-binding factor RbfA [Patescibacteria group bacterium]|nr:30S ribosome-binding factor RbfA [Patescibacteria group bacterium]